jgi:hypothetical protein
MHKITITLLKQDSEISELQLTEALQVAIDSIVSEDVNPLVQDVDGIDLFLEETKD